jgi:hypothetical protein
MEREMKGKVWLTAVLLACVGTQANAANATVASGVSWTAGLTGERAAAAITSPESSGSSFELTAVTHPAVGKPANLQSASAVTLPMAVGGEAGAPATGNFILDSFSAVPSSAAAWWFGSALLGLTIVARRRDGKRPSED